MKRTADYEKIEAIVIGASTGGMEAVKTILSSLPANFPVPILIAQHVSPYSDGYMTKYLQESCQFKVKEADEKEKAISGIVYIAPANYHLLIEKDFTLSLTVNPKVNYARPSIDVLFETAADAFRKSLIGVVLTGANSDGSNGIKRIKELGGIVIIQDPKTAEAQSMPNAAIKSVQADFILDLHDIGPKLIDVIGEKR